MPKERIAKLDAHVRKCFDLLLVAHKQYANLRPMMGDQKLLDRIGRENKNRGFDTIRFTLYWNLVQELVKIVADDDGRVPSIHNFRKHFEDGQVKGFLKEKFSVWPSLVKDTYHGELKKVLKQSDKQDENERRQLFDSRYDKVMKESEELLNSPALASMKDIRDKILAHNELNLLSGSYRFVEPKDFGLKYGDERVVLEKATLVFDDFFVLVTQIYFDWNEFKAITNRDADEFWKE
ncbi:MAG: hypothetical protein ABSE90_09680 [Verrucomicrobiota bacterium]